MDMAIKKMIYFLLEKHIISDSGDLHAQKDEKKYKMEAIFPCTIIHQFHLPYHFHLFIIFTEKNGGK